MAMTISTIGYGIALSHCATSSGTFVPLAEILEITPPASNGEEVKVYRSDNTAAVVEKIPGWLENGDCEATISYAPAQRATLEALVMVAGFWKVTYPKFASQTTTGDVDAFAGFIKALGKETPLKGSMTCKVKIAVNGAVVTTTGT